MKPLSLISMSQSQGTRATKPILTSAKLIGLPYDKVVWKLLKFIKLIVLDPTKADFIISNDNGDEIVSISDKWTDLNPQL